MGVAKNQAVMPTTPLQRIMFLQGEMCFFCNRRIPAAEASADHLMPESQGGTGSLGNLVACCKTLNLMFGGISLKEKIRAILNQKGNFMCPNQKSKALPAPSPQKPKVNGQAPANPGAGCAASQADC